MPNTSCPVFLHSEGEHAIRAITEGTMSTIRAAVILDIDESAVWECFRNHDHWRPVETKEIIEIPDDDPSLTLREILKDLRIKVRQVL